MIINKANLNGVFNGFKTAFNKGMESAESHYRDIAMVVPSKTREETYGWLGQFPKLREWVGDRVIRNLAAHSYALRNKLFEDTIGVKRVDIEDDQYGVLTPILEEMGRAAAEHPDELVFNALKNGINTQCFDGQYFFDTDHPVNGQSVSNLDATGTGPYWFLLDTRKAIKPLLFQEREPYDLKALVKDEDENVFMRDEYLYGVRARANAGYGLWQLAYASNQPLDEANYVKARTAMMELKGEEDRPLGITPNLLVVPPSLEKDALSLLSADLLIDQKSNVWRGTADLIVSPWLV
jgi:phage major head subunit gpT-like protein